MESILNEDTVEMALTNCIVNIKHSLDAHMECYQKMDGKRVTSYDEAVSISVVARTAYESASQVLQFIDLANIKDKHLKPKHLLCVRLCRKIINDIHHNNLIIDHPKSDATKFGIGVVTFLTAMHHTLAEATPDADRSRYAQTYFVYNQYCHEDDPTKVAVVPSLAARGAAYAHKAGSLRRVS